MVDNTTIEQLQAIAAHNDKVWALAWHQSGKLLATASSDKLIKIWGPDCANPGQLSHKSNLEGAHTRTIRSLAWKPHC